MERVSNTVLLDAQVFEKISNDTNKIVAEQLQYPVELLEYTLNDEQTFKTLFNIFQNAHKFKIASDSSMDDETYEYEKIPFLEAIEVARDKGLIKLNSITYSRYKTLLDLISYGILKKQLQNKTIQAKVDGITYNIPANKIIEFLELDTKTLDDYINTPNRKGSISKEAFLYIVRRFIIREELMDNFIFPENIEKRITDIVNYEILDFESQNTYLSDGNSLTSKTNLNPELIEAITKDIPANYSTLEKAIFIYIKMCKILSYNDEFFAAKQRGLAAEKHRMIDYIETISPQFPEVVCYEFNAIYAKMLHSLGINFQRECFSWKNKYGDGHENLSFRVGKYIIEADSSRKILTGDLFNAKVGNSIKGLKCRNQNFDTYMDFDEILRKVYKDIKKEDKSTFSEALKEYEELTNAKQAHIPFNTRFDLFLEKIRTSSFNGLNIMSYILRLVNVLFTEEEREHYIDFEIIRDNNPKDEDKIVATCGIITMNEKGILKDEEHNKYYIYINGELKRILKRTLIRNIITGTLGFIDSEEQYIPGIR